MDYLKSFKSFINSQYLSEGVRITTGVLLPVFLMAYFNQLSTGVLVALGALFVSVTDGPGPIHHRKNGMIVCIASILLVTLVTGFIVHSTILLAFFLVIGCFFFSMIGIYGARAGSIGTASMIVLTLTIDPRNDLATPIDVMRHSLLMASGGLWYMCYSMLLYNFRPYRLAQQALGDCIQATGQYLMLRAELYNKNVNYESTYSRLLLQQAEVQQKQTDLNELLFKTRSIVKESTNTGRVLVMIHLEVADIFESIMMSHQRYSVLHQYFDETDILNDYYELAKQMAIELNVIGIAVKSGERSVPNDNLQNQVNKTREHLDALRLTYLKPDNIEGFISLRRILENIQDLAARLATLHKYTGYDRKVDKAAIKNSAYEKMVTSQQVTPGMFFNNLTLKSATFRHSLRVSIAVLVGYLVALVFHIGHSYWMLLTIIVILKPAYSLTKKRNGNRLAGTFAGILIGVVILTFVNDSRVLLALLIIFMVAGYTFMRTNYFLSVLFMTPYLLLFYHLLNPPDFQAVLKDRVIDTIIGSAIAFMASSFLFPLWEKDKIKPVMVAMLVAIKDYFSVVANRLNNTHVNVQQQQLARKNTLVALANLSDAFNRLISEPKSQQKGMESLHQFVVLNHILTSYIASLAHYIQIQPVLNGSDEFLQVSQDIQQNIANAIACLQNDEKAEKATSHKETLRKLNEKANELLQKRQHELQQGFMETATRKSLFDLKSVVDQFNLIYSVAAEINKLIQALAPSLKMEGKSTSA